MSVFYFSVFFFSMSRWESFDRLLFIKCICTFFVVAKVSYLKKSRGRQVAVLEGRTSFLLFSKVAKENKNGTK
jgi:hypothetical protein